MLSERPPTARTRLSRGLDAFYGAVDGGAVDVESVSRPGLGPVRDKHVICRFVCSAGKIDARYLDGAGELGGGHGNLLCW